MGTYKNAIAVFECLVFKQEAVLRPLSKIGVKICQPSCITQLITLLSKEEFFTTWCVPGLVCVILLGILAPYQTNKSSPHGVNELNRPMRHVQ